MALQHGLPIKHDPKQMRRDFETLVEGYVTSDRKLQVLKLIDHLDKAGFFKGPASSKKQFHMAEYGGLAMHTWNFIMCMMSFAKLFFGKDQISGLYWGANPDKSMDLPQLLESCVIIGLCHDLNKVRMLGKAYYVPNILKGNKQSEAEPYRVGSRTALGSTAQVLLAIEFVDLKPDEIQAIRYAEGLYDRSYQQDVGNKEEVLTYLAHWADMASSQVVECLQPAERDHKTWRQHLSELTGKEEADLITGQLEIPLA